MAKELSPQEMEERLNRLERQVELLIEEGPGWELATEDEIKAIEEAWEDHANGKTIPIEEVARRLGLDV